MEGALLLPRVADPDALADFGSGSAFLESSDPDPVFRSVGSGSGFCQEIQIKIPSKIRLFSIYGPKFL